MTEPVRATGVAILFSDDKTVEVIAVDGFDESARAAAMVARRFDELAHNNPYFAHVGFEPIAFNPAHLFFPVWPDVDSYLAQYADTT